MYAKRLVEFLNLLIIVGIIILLFVWVVFYADVIGGVTPHFDPSAPTMVPFEYIVIFEANPEGVQCIGREDAINLTITPFLFNATGEYLGVIDILDYKITWEDAASLIEVGAMYKNHKYRWVKYGGYDYTVFSIDSFSFDEGWICIKTESVQIPDIPFEK